MFDLSPKHALYLSYWTDGDTRRRGEVLATVQGGATAPAASSSTPTASCPTTCRWCSSTRRVADPADGRQLLQEYRPSLELLRIALDEKQTPYAGALAAVCATLPGESPATAPPCRRWRAGRPAGRVGRAGRRTTRACSRCARAGWSG